MLKLPTIATEASTNVTGLVFQQKSFKEGPEVTINPVLERILRTREFEGKNNETLRVFAEISQDEGEFLQRIVSDIDPRTSIEIGLAYGVSAMFICDALTKTPDTRHIVIDPAQLMEPWQGNGIHNLKKAGHGDLIDLYPLQSQLALPQLEEKGVKVDFAFIDGHHTFDFALTDFFYVDRMLKIGGVIAFDDADFPSIEKLIRFVLKNRNYAVYGSVGGGRRDRFRHLRRASRGMVAKSPRLGRLLHPAFLESKQDLHIDGSCVALRKVNDDTRGYSWQDLGHYDF